jgi:hypothetical protein
VAALALAAAPERAGPLATPPLLPLGLPDVLAVFGPDPSGGFRVGDRVVLTEADEQAGTLLAFAGDPELADPGQLGAATALAGPGQGAGSYGDVFGVVGSAGAPPLGFSSGAESAGAPAAPFGVPASVLPKSQAAYGTAQARDPELRGAWRAPSPSEPAVGPVPARAVLAVLALAVVGVAGYAVCRKVLKG